MKRFLHSTLLFFLILLSLIVIIIFLPATPSASKSLLYSSIQKDSLLQNTPEPRIILLGGSNVSYGINSQIIKDSLGLNPINASIHAGIGIKYMLDHAEPLLKKGDVLLLIPEYQQFYMNSAYGNEELLRTVLEVYPYTIHTLSIDQLISIARYIPNYLKSKIMIDSYLKDAIPMHYTYKAFNEYGDAVVHWKKEKEAYGKIGNFTDPSYNEKALKYLLDFINRVSDKGILVYISYPATQDISFEAIKEQIKEIQYKYEENKLNILGTPELFDYPDSLTFDSPYHLNKKGADKRTIELVQLIKNKKGKL